MKKIILITTTLLSITAFSAEYSVEVTDNMFDFNGSLYGKIVNTGNETILGDEARIVPSTPEVYEQLKGTEKGAVVTVKGYSTSKKSHTRISATSVSK